MPEVIFTGPAGRIEGRYHPARQKNAPIAIMLHPAPAVRRDDEPPDRLPALLRLRAPRTSRCCGSISAASAAARARSTTARANCRMRLRARLGADHQSGGAQLLDRRLLVRRLDRHAAADAPARDRGLHLDRPPANLYDFSFLAPCPSSGLIIHGDKDAVVPHKDVTDAGRQAEDPEGHRDRAEGHPRRQPFLRRQGRSR